MNQDNTTDKTSASSISPEISLDNTSIQGNYDSNASLVINLKFTVVK